MESTKAEKYSVVVRVSFPPSLRFLPCSLLCSLFGRHMEEECFLWGTRQNPGCCHIGHGTCSSDQPMGWSCLPSQVLLLLPHETPLSKAETGVDNMAILQALQAGLWFRFLFQKPCLPRLKGRRKVNNSSLQVQEPRSVIRYGLRCWVHIQVLLNCSRKGIIILETGHLWHLGSFQQHWGHRCLYYQTSLMIQHSSCIMKQTPWSSSECKIHTGIVSFSSP